MIYACSQHSCAGTWWVNQPGVWFSWADVGAAWVPARGSSFTYSYTNHNVGDDSSSIASSRVSRGYHSNPSPRRFDSHNRPVDENDFWAGLPLFCCGWGGTAVDFEPSSTPFQNLGVWLCVWLTLSLPKSSYCRLWFCQRTLSKGSLGSQKYSFRDLYSTERCTRSLTEIWFLMPCPVWWLYQGETKSLNSSRMSWRQMGNTFPRNRMSYGVLRAVKGLICSIQSSQSISVINVINVPEK